MTYTDIRPVLFLILLLVGIGGFLLSTWRLARLALLGAPHPEPFVNIGARLGDLLRFVFLQKRVVDRPFGWNHVLFFWGFLIITVGHAEFMVGGVFPSFTMDQLPAFIAFPILVGSDVLAFLVIFAVLIALYRRLFVKPWFIHHHSLDGFVVLGLIGLVMVTYFLATSAGIALARPELIHHAAWLPVSNAFANTVLHDASATVLSAVFETFYWAHAGVLFFFLNYIPYSKHQHLLGAIPNVFLREGVKPKGALRRIDFEKPDVESFGVSKVTEFTWKQLLDTYACTECGRCDLNCPATNTKKPLEPQQLIHDIKGNLYANGDAILRGRKLVEIGSAPKDFAPSLPLIAKNLEERKKGSQTAPEILWSCTTCGACVEACPVLIDHVGAILDLRRFLTMTQGDIAPELAKTFGNIETNYNPWGIGHDKRVDWAKEMGLAYWGGSSGANTFEILFWVGCAGSFDLRAQKTVKAFARVMNAAGLKYAILGSAEKCTGDPARRSGHEYLFDALAKENVQTLNDYGVKKIVTACPHCFNALKNEYPAFGGNYEVIHHTQLLDQLIRDGRIKLDAEVVKTATYHDPCYLGRWNGEYDSPRRTLGRMNGLRVLEMERHGRNAMCCGAGGGQMWMEEKLGTRVNAERTRQALATGSEVIAVACPFCMTMLEDGVKGAGKDGEVEVVDVVELVERAMAKPS